MTEKLGTTVVLEIWKDWETEEKPEKVGVENVYNIRHKGSGRHIWLSKPSEVHVVMFANTDKYEVRGFGSSKELVELWIETGEESK